MKYCSRCVLPETRPNLVIGADGVCNACRMHESKALIDWSRREADFRLVVQNAQTRSTGYDCLIPVSGGKDSTWQVVKCLEFGLTPLAVTWRSPGRTSLGQQNLENLIGLGVDHIDFQVNPRVDRHLMTRALLEKGSSAIPMHLALFAFPLKIAAGLGIPLVIWGENAAFEYGSSDETLTGFRLDSRWLRTFGVTQGTTALDWSDDVLSRRALEPYMAPDDGALDRAGVTAIFLGYYFRWDPRVTRAVAERHGFRAREAGPKTGMWNYADIDDDYISVHHFLKWYKFGFTRSFDNLSVEIRNGAMTRAQAVEAIAARGDETPHDDIAKVCAYLRMSTKEFFAAIERFRNPEVWKRIGGVWTIPGFIIPDWPWENQTPNAVTPEFE